MKRVLVTGATGFIGRHTLLRLQALGYQVHAVSNKSSPQKNIESVAWHCANLLVPEEITALMNKVRPSHLLHFAWYAQPGKFWTAPENLDWVKATVCLMQAFYEVGGHRLVMAGSCAEYDWSFDFCSEASTPCHPATLYGSAKHSVQILLNAWAAQTGLSSAWGRIFFLYGPGEYPSRLVPSVISSLMNGEPARCTHGNQVRDFMYVEDVAAAFVALLESNIEGVINIASGAPVSLRNVISTISDFLHQPNLVEFGAIPSPAGEPQTLFANTSRLVNELGFRSQYSLHDGIAKTIESMKIRTSNIK